MRAKSILKKIHFFLFPPSISFGITVCDESEELEKLLAQVIKEKGRRDEMIVVQDMMKTNDAVDAVIRRYKRHIRHTGAERQRDFATFKNNLAFSARRSLLFQIDADELLSTDAVRLLKRCVSAQKNADVFIIARENFVDGIKAHHLQQWDWELDDRQRINYPDRQVRIFRLGRQIHWTRKVHETLTGFKAPVNLDEDIFLIHRKNIKRQEEQNAFYDLLMQDDVAQSLPIE